MNIIVNGKRLNVGSLPEFSGSGGGSSGPPKPKTPVKKPGKKPKK